MITMEDPVEYSFMHGVTHLKMAIIQLAEGPARRALP